MVSLFTEVYFLNKIRLEEQNIKKKAGHFYTLAAQLTQSDARLWEKIGNLFKYQISLSVNLINILGKLFVLNKLVILLEEH